jgi:type I restriction enzyme M protein
MIDASCEFRAGRAQNELLPEHESLIYGWYRDYADVEGVARVVTLDEIAANDYNLNIPRYIEPRADQEAVTVEEAMRRLKETSETAFAAEARLIAIFRREGLIR